jgi:hypothetical protein
MRFMILVKATTASEARHAPDDAQLARLDAYHAELVKAGVLLAADLLKPSASGARLQYTGDRRTIIAGPFLDSGELVTGYTLIEVKTYEEALEWFKRFPHPHPGEDCEIELRQVVERTTLSV